MIRVFRPKAGRSTAMLLVGLALAGVCAFSPSAARAGGPTVCPGASGLPSGSYAALVVPTGVTCILNGSTITAGRVRVEPGGRLFVGDSASSNLAIRGNLDVGTGAQFSFSESCRGCVGVSTLTIGGNVLADHASVLDLPGATVDGNVVVTGLSSEITMVFAKVDGNIIVTGSTGALVSIGFDTISGQLLVVDNDLAVGPGFGFIIVGGNQIGGNLICLGNNPQPSNEGSPNTVGRRALGQCAGL